MARILIDLTPVLPGGANGGLKVMVLELIKQLARISTHEYILLTSNVSHQELSVLDAANVSRICVLYRHKVKKIKFLRKILRIKIFYKLFRYFNSILPEVFKRFVLNVCYRIYNCKKRSNFLDDVQFDLLFCPFAAPFYYKLGVPVVSVICDLQFYYYPNFFSHLEFYNRDLHFKDACKKVNFFICISNFVRKNVIAHSGFSPDRVKTIHISMSNRLPTVMEAGKVIVLARFQLQNKEFLLYPANFWRHKNHKILFVAFAMLRANYPQLNIKLVCTGALGKRRDELKRVVNLMGLSECIIFPGYLHDKEFACIMSGCKAVIFPSLYEGFGMPIVEAMLYGKPVLCSNKASLPEVAGDAALFFDPRKPHEIFMQLKRLCLAQDSLGTIIQRGHERVQLFANPHKMAQEYLQVFAEAMNITTHYQDYVNGICADNWCKQQVSIYFSKHKEERVLKMDISLPSFVPYTECKVKVKFNSDHKYRTYVLQRDKNLHIQCVLPINFGHIELIADRRFCPAKLGINNDTRKLSYYIENCLIVSGKKMNNLLCKEDNA